MSLPVHIKHAGKVYDLELNTNLSPTAFKDAIYRATGVPTDRMKVMIKGGVLKVCHQMYCDKTKIYIHLLRMIRIGRKLPLKLLVVLSLSSTTLFYTRFQQGQTFMVIGAAGELPKPPENKTVFLEGM
jgi:ubiquitin carboxyl-terminal hydrolase 14